MYPDQVMWFSLSNSRQFYSFRLLRVCISGIVDDCLGNESVFFQIILDCVKSILRVFLNLTHDNGKWAN